MRKPRPSRWSNRSILAEIKAGAKSRRLAPEAAGSGVRCEDVHPRPDGVVGPRDPDEERRVSDEQPQHEPPLVAPGATSGSASDGAAASPAPPWTGQGGPGLPPPPAYGSPTGRPLHKPGTVPLRPLTLSDFFDGAFTTVRRNPRSTIGMGALVTAGFMLLPIVVSLAIGLSGGLDGARLSATSGSSEPSASTFVLYGVSGDLQHLRAARQRGGRRARRAGGHPRRDRGEGDHLRARGAGCAGDSPR